MGKHVAIDCHQSSLYVVAATSTGEVLWRRRFAATTTGEEDLLRQLAPDDVVVLEATRGAHHRANRLDASGANVRIIDPQQAPLVGFRGKKTDYRDCLALLQHLRSGTLVDVWRPDPLTRTFRQLTRERAAYNQGLVQLKNRIRALLKEEGLTGPGELLWSEHGSAWIAEQTLPEHVRRVLLREWAALQAWCTVKAAQEEEIAQLALAHPEAGRLLQIVGFGPTAILVFLGEVGALERFATGKHLVSYAGLDPRVSQSGERCRGGGITKAGRAPLRWMMVEVAWAHVLGNGPEAEHYHRLVARGKPKQVAIVALTRRLLILAYLLLTRKESQQQLDPEKYEAKLRRVAVRRRPAEVQRERHVDWAAARFEETVGKPAPSRERRQRRAQGSLPSAVARSQAQAPAEDEASSEAGVPDALAETASVSPAQPHQRGRRAAKLRPDQVPQPDGADGAASLPGPKKAPLRPG